MAQQRNAPCPCGSGKKFKACCASKRTARQWVALLSVGLFAIAAVWVVGGAMLGARSGGDSADPPGQVWSEEHGHYHAAPGTAGTPQPPGPVPPGKVWSLEHGHWHDAAADAPAAGDAPPGKVWSAEHGHWHDAPAGSVPDTPPGEPGVSYSEAP